MRCGFRLHKNGTGVEAKSFGIIKIFIGAFVVFVASNSYGSVVAPSSNMTFFRIAIHCSAKVPHIAVKVKVTGFAAEPRSQRLRIVAKIMGDAGRKKSFVIAEAATFARAAIGINQGFSAD